MPARPVGLPGMEVGQLDGMGARGIVFNGIKLSSNVSINVKIASSCPSLDVDTH